MVRKTERALIFLFFTFLVFGLLLATGTITSGLHYVDDHEFLEYEIIITQQEGTILDCIQKALAEDIGTRFRPMYYILRVLLFSVCRTNLIGWSICKAIEIILALFFLYLIARKLNCNILYAILFALVAMVGPQSVVWWKLGPQESTGTLLFSVCFYFLIKWLESERKGFAVASWLFAFLMALYKESFLLLVPFLVVFIFYYSVIKDGITHGVLARVVKRNGCLLGAYIILFLAVIGIILYAVGIFSPGYVGIDTGKTPNEYKNTWINIFQNYLKYFIWLAVPACLLLLTYIKNWKRLIVEGLLACIIMVPQMIVYINTGLEERYILPWSIGFAYFFVIAINRIKENGVRKIIYAGFLIAFLVPHFAILIREAEYFTYRGHSITAVLDEALAISGPESNILSAYSPYEESDITVSCWMQLRGRDNVYTWNEAEKTCTDRSGEGYGREEDGKNMDIILFYNPEDRHFCYEPDIDLTGYQRYNYGTMTMCIRK